MSAVPTAKVFAPRTLDLRGRGAQPSVIPTVVAPIVPSIVQFAPTSQRRWGRRLGIHLISLGLLSGLLATIIINSVPPRQAVASPVILSPAQASDKVAAPAPAPTARAAIPAKPTDRLLIPSLGVNAGVMTLGLTAGGALDVPKTLWQVGWYRGGVKPGDNGTAIFDGHSGAPGQYGVLENLSRVKVGQILTYSYVDGRTLTFKVVSSRAYPETQASAERLFAKTVTPSLNVISCYGRWNPKTEDYDQRWIITSELVK